MPRNFNRRFVYVAIIASIVIIFVYLLNGNHARRQGSAASPLKATSLTSPSIKLSASTSWSCTDFETAYDANYFNQLYVVWATWDKIVSLLPYPDVTSSAVINYQYNASASHAYNLYAASIRGNNCTPALAAPAVLSPARAPDGSFSPPGFNPNVPISCNLPLAITALNSANGQFNLAQDNVQAHLDTWVQRSDTSSFTLADQQASASFAVQLFEAAKILAQNFQNEAGNAGC